MCNAAETLLVHADVAAAFLPRALGALRAAGVELRVDERTRALAGALADGAATEEDCATEFLALVLAVGWSTRSRRRSSTSTAYGSGHSEAIVTGSAAAARAFQLGVDAACVYVNASTRFTDGGEFGMGAEIGNSTQKLHARGPIGLRELCSFRYLVEGEGQVRAERAVARVGLLGGTFNPPHLGHLVCARRRAPARARPRAARAGGQPPHKEVDGDPGVEERVELCRRPRATSGLEVSRVEVDRAGASCTVDTLRALRAAEPADELTFIVGGDMAHALPSWREPEAVLALARLGVAEREGVAAPTSWSRSPGSRRPGARRLLRHAADRRLVLAASAAASPPAGRVRYLVPGAVAERIARSGSTAPNLKGAHERDRPSWSPTSTARRRHRGATPPTRRRSTSSSSTCAGCSATPTTS